MREAVEASDAVRLWKLPRNHRAAGELQRAPKQPEWPPPTLKLADLLDLTNLD